MLWVWSVFDKVVTELLQIDVSAEILAVFAVLFGYFVLGEIVSDDFIDFIQVICGLRFHLFDFLLIEEIEFFD